MANKVDIDTLSPDLVDAAITTAITETVSEIATDKTLHDTHSEPFRVGIHARTKVERILGVEFDTSSAEWLEALVYREIRDAGRYTTPKARKLLIREFYEGACGAIASDRWQCLINLLLTFGYFDNVDVNDVLAERDWGAYSNCIIKNHGLTIGWNTNLVHGYGRLGIDSEWNKVSDATILLYWPGVDDMGKRKWNDLVDCVEEMLDADSTTHRVFVKQWDRCHADYSIDMTPTYGKDA